MMLVSRLGHVAHAPAWSFGVVVLSYARRVATATADELAKITSRHLRQADEMCRRRLALDLDDQRGNAPGSARFEVGNRFTADARLAHTELAPPDPRAFVVPSEMLPEQQRVYEAAVAGYLTLFGDQPARAVDLRFETVLDDLGVRLVGDVGIALDTDDGCELRVVRLGSRGFGKLLDDVDLCVATVRTAGWAAGRGPLRVVVADVLDLEVAHLTLDVDAEVEAARAWIAGRVEHIRTLAADPRPRPGHDCLGCRFVAGCRAHA
jgi:hypothetical protein